MVLTKEEVAGYASWKAAGTPLAMFLESCQQLEGAFVDFLEAEGEILRKGRYFQLVNTSSSDARGPAFLTFVRRYNGWRVWESCGMGRPLLDWSDAELGIWSSCEWNIYPQILPPAGVPVLVSNGKKTLMGSLREAPWPAEAVWTPAGVLEGTGFWEFDSREIRAWKFADSWAVGMDAGLPS